MVSGLAVGIDRAAHAATVAAERSTVAALGSRHGRLLRALPTDRTAGRHDAGFALTADTVLPYPAIVEAASRADQTAARSR